MKYIYICFFLVVSFAYVSMYKWSNLRLIFLWLTITQMEYKVRVFLSVCMMIRRRVSSKSTEIAHHIQSIELICGNQLTNTRRSLMTTNKCHVVMNARKLMKKLDKHIILAGLIDKYHIFERNMISLQISSSLVKKIIWRIFWVKNRSLSAQNFIVLNLNERIEFKLEFNRFFFISINKLEKKNVFIS